MSPIGLSETWRMGPMQRNYAYDHMGRLKVRIIPWGPRLVSEGGRISQLHILVK